MNLPHQTGAIGRCNMNRRLKIILLKYLAEATTAIRETKTYRLFGYEIKIRKRG